MSSRHLFTMIFVLYTALTLGGCGGGGDDGSSPAAGDDPSLPTDIETASIAQLLDLQNDDVEDYFARQIRFLEQHEALEERLFLVDATDIDAVVSILQESKENYLLLDEVYGLSDELNTIDQALEESDDTSSKSVRPRQVEIRPQDGGLVTLTFCAIAGAAWGVSYYKDTKAYYQAFEQCDETYDTKLRQLKNGDYSQEFKDKWAIEYQTDLSLCKDIARRTYYIDSFISWGDTTVTSNAPSLATGKVKVVLETLSAVRDADTVADAIVGRQADGDVSLKVFDLQSTQLRSFFAKTDDSGIATVPEGDWDIVVYSKDHARVGTSNGQALSISEGETMTLNATTIPTSDATSSNIQNCESAVGGTCAISPSIALGEEGRYYFVKHIYYPLGDSDCFTAEEIEYYENTGEHSVWLDEDRPEACKICPDGYALGDFEGVQTCLRCPDGKDISDGCCY